MPLCAQNCWIHQIIALCCPPPPKTIAQEHSHAVISCFAGPSSKNCSQDAASRGQQQVSEIRTSQKSKLAKYRLALRNPARSNLILRLATHLIANKPRNLRYKYKETVNYNMAATEQHETNLIKYVTGTKQAAMTFRCARWSKRSDYLRGNTNVFTGSLWWSERSDHLR